MLLLYHCYPFDKFLVNGKPWIEREENQFGKLQKRDRSLRKFQAYLGLSYSYRQSGDKTRRKFQGSAIVRSHLYVWAVCMVAPSNYRIQSDLGVKGKDALIRILFKATRMLFYELLGELVR
jgi:transposase